MSLFLPPPPIFFSSEGDFPFALVCLRIVSNSVPKKRNTIILKKNPHILTTKLILTKPYNKSCKAFEIKELSELSRLNKL